MLAQQKIFPIIPHMKKSFEHTLEHGLFASRWLMAPFYIGLVGALAVLVYTFGLELLHFIMNAPDMKANDAILASLALIDISLAGNLLIIVIFSGYENFISKLDVGDHKDQPEWMGTVDFSTLKLKLIASIVAISGIHLLKIFMEIKKYDNNEIMWMVIIHLVFVVSGVMLALMDKISASAKLTKKSK
jgi:uncharacterized protein (TIGR00645 family)